MLKTPNILVCPLDWGLGHATRCVPVIQLLIDAQCSVFIAGSGRSIAFLKEEFPACTFIDLPSYRFIYNGTGLMSLAMLLSSPMIIWSIFYEHKLLAKMIKKYDIHAVISDNRFGLWNNKIPCVYISHQIKIRTHKNLKFLEPLLHKIHRYFIKKYNQLWIPDYEKIPNLSGELAHGFKKDFPFYFVGPLSRFSGPDNEQVNIADAESPDILAIVSGPEPQRSIFERMIIEQAPLVNNKIVLLQGIPGKGSKPILYDNIKIYPHLETKALKNLIVNAGIVLCRPGYSSIMDLAVLRKKAFFIPTPGQTEQEYLAEFLKAQTICNYAHQKHFRLADIIDKSSEFSGFNSLTKQTMIEQPIENFVEYLYNSIKAS